MSEPVLLSDFKRGTVVGPERHPVAEATAGYFDELSRAMTLLGEHKQTMFMGQGVGCAGTTMSETFNGVPAEKRLEMPVAEDMQMGMAIGMSLNGYIPVCVFPRWNFLLLAANQLINHLDRLELYSGFRPKVIIRTAVPSSSPFNPGPQHDDDFTFAFRGMLRTVNMMTLRTAAAIVPAYQDALASAKSTIIVEYTEYYRNERGK